MRKKTCANKLNNFICSISQFSLHKETTKQMGNIDDELFLSVIGIHMNLIRELHGEPDAFRNYFRHGLLTRARRGSAYDLGETTEGL